MKTARRACGIVWLCLAVAAQPLQAQTTVAGATPASFRVTETGAAEYRIPIKVPPGIAGMEPKLSFTYSSQSGNGVLGLGWGLAGLSQVHRCGRTIVQDGTNAGVKYTSGDKYCLDGQRLVAVASSTYGADGAEYRTERESFTKVISYSTAGSGPAWFKAWTKSGLVLEFGNTTDSRLEAQGKSDVRIWAVNRIADVKGNAITFTYAEDNTNGDYQLSRIDYTSNTGQSLSAGQSVRFTYETRTDNQPQSVGGATVSTQKRMTNAKTYVGDTVVRDYRVAYDYGGMGSASRVTSIKECSGDGAYCLEPIALTWQSSSGSFGFGSAATSGVNWSSGNANGSRAAIADVNGDGLGDLVYTNGGTVYFALSTGGGFGSPSSVASQSNVCVESNEAGCLAYLALFATGDLNGDGLADIVMGNGAVYLSTGSGFSSAGNWGIGLTNGWPSWPARIADADGDGKNDLFYVSGSAILVAYSTGSSFSSPVTVATDSSRCVSWDGEAGCTGSEAAFAVGDLDGDGRADVVTGAGVVYLSTGTGFSSAGNWGASLSPSTYHFPVIADVNGDGRGDLVAQAGGQITVRYSSGTAFGGAASVFSNPAMCADSSEAGCVTYAAKIAAGDVNGDGLADILGGTTISVTGPLAIATAPVPDAIAQFADSLGATIALTYSALSSSSVYTMESGATWPARQLRPQALLRVVSATSVSDGIGGNRSTSYVYRGGRVHHTGGGFLGFRELEAVDGGTGIKSISSFRQDYPYRGLPLISERKQSSGTSIGKTTNTWTDTSLTPASGSGGNYHKSELTQQVEESRELNGNLVVTVTNTTTYDSYGNATAVTVSTGDGYSKVTTNTYATADTTNWFLGRLTRATVESTKP